MNRNKIVFIIVEGPSDDEALGVIFSRAFDKDAALIRSRNKQKSENMDKLSRQSQVWDSVPYQCYYMSSNLDHVLHNLLNCSSEDKERNAFLFAKKYKNALGEFLQFLCESDFSVNTSYRESWDFIKEGLRSLERHSNLGLCFKEIRRGE